MSTNGDSDEDDQMDGQMLSQFYGDILGGGDPLSGLEAGEDSAQHAHGFAGGGGAMPHGGDDDIDSPYFDASQFVQDKLRSYHIRDLVQFNNELNGEVKALDSDMQMLVYENYNKFISATDTIRNMKAEVESMEQEMDNLFENMEEINSSCAKIEVTLAPNRQKIEKLVGVRRLLKRLQFLFELPKRLRESIELGAHGEAVRAFKMSTYILQRCQHIPSFQNIQTESEEIVRELKLKLKDELTDSSRSAFKQMETAGLLRDLNEPPEDLWTDVLRTRKVAFQNALRIAVNVEEIKLDPPAPREDAAAAAPSEVDERSHSDESKASPPPAALESTNPFAPRTHSMSTSSSTNPFAPQGAGADAAASAGGGASTNPFAPSASADTNPFSRSRSNTNEEPSSSRTREPSEPSRSARTDSEARNEQKQPQQVPQDDDEEAQRLRQMSSRSSLRVSRLRQHFVLAFVEFAKGYRETFVTPFKKSGARSTDGSRIWESAMSALTAFTGDLFDSYFEHASQAFDEQPSIPELSSELFQFYECLSEPSRLVPDGNILDRAKSIVTGALDSCIRRTFRKAQTTIFEEFQRCDEAVSRWSKEAGILSPPSQPKSSPSSTSSHRSPHTLSHASTSHDKNTKLITDRTRGVSKLMVAALGDAFAALLSLRNSSEDSILRVLDIPVVKRLRESFLHTIGEVCRTLREDSILEYSGPIHVAQHEETLDELTKDPLPFHYLFRSQICASMVDHVLPSTLANFLQTFSVDRNNRREIERADKSTLTSICQDSAQIILQKYVEVRGLEIAALLAQNVRECQVEHLRSKPSEYEQPEDARPVVREISKLLVDIDYELERVFTAPVERFVRQPPRNRGGARNREIARLFTKKISIYSHIERKRPSAILGIFKVALKRYVEHLRTCTLEKPLFQQLQVDAFAVRSIAPSSLSHEDFEEIESLVDEVVTSAAERCLRVDPFLEFDVLQSVTERYSPAK